MGLDTKKVAGTTLLTGGQGGATGQAALTGGDVKTGALIDAAALGSAAGGGAAALGGGGTAGTAGAAGAAGAGGAGGILSSLSTAATVLSAGSSLMSATNAKKALAGVLAKQSGDLPVEKPTVEKPTAMPTFGGADTQTVLKNALLEQSRRRGRASTILTSESLGA